MSSENLPTAEQKMGSSAPGTLSAQDTITNISTDELARQSVVISARLGRSFAGRHEFDDEKALDAAIEEARRALPEVASAYKATGKTTVLAAVLMLAATPVVLLLLLGICGALCWGWLQLLSTMFSGQSDPSYSGSRLTGLVSLFLDLILVILMVVIPMYSFGLISRWTKNRNPKLPAILTGVVDLAVAVALFLPIWKGETLAPTHLTFVFIPIRWVLIVVGGILAPFLAAAVVHGKVGEQKFCEETGCFLKKVGEVKISFDLGENALALLQRGQYAAAIRLPGIPENEIKQKHGAAISLWWKENAATAFLELNMRFHGKSKPKKALTTQQAKDKTKEWLACSVRLDRGQAEILAPEFRPMFRS